MSLIGSANHLNIINGGFYQVIDWTDTQIFIQDLETNETLTMTHEDASYCRAGWAITYQACQGRTLKERTKIHDSDHRFFSTIHLSLGISRITDKSLLEID